MGGSPPARRRQRYRAIVCVFLFGGNDSNNMIIPFTDYAAYAAVRTAASGVALTQAQLLHSRAQGGRLRLPSEHGAGAAAATTAGKLAVLANAGPLLAPITKAVLRGQPSTVRRTCFRTRTSRSCGTACSPTRRYALAGVDASRTGAPRPMRDRRFRPSCRCRARSSSRPGSPTAPFVIPSSGGVVLTGQGTDAVPDRALQRTACRCSERGGGNQVVVGAAGVMDKALVTAECDATRFSRQRCRPSSRLSSVRHRSTPASRSSCGRSPA